MACATLLGFIRSWLPHVAVREVSAHFAKLPLPCSAEQCISTSTYAPVRPSLGAGSVALSRHNVPAAHFPVGAERPGVSQ